MSKIRRTELPVHNVHRVRLVEQAVPTPEGVFVAVTVIVEDEEGQEEKIATLYPGNGSSINIVV